MQKKMFRAGTMILLAVALLLSACGTPKAPAAPTADANAIYTQAAATVSTGLTQAAQKNPPATATVAPPSATATSLPASPSPTVAQPGPDNQTTTPTQAGAAQTTATKAAGVTPVPTATKAAAATSSLADKAEWVSQSPADKTQIQKSATFTMTYVLKNTGKTTWTKKYSLRFYAGPMSEPKDINLTKDVKPGETVEIKFELVAPDSVGKSTNIWVMSTDLGVNFYVVTLDLETIN